MRKLTRIMLVIGLAIMIILQTGLDAYASQPKNSAKKAEKELTPEEKKKKEEEEKRKKEMEKVYKMEIQTNNLTNWPKGPGVYGESAIVMDMKSGAILYAKNIDDKHYPASITKILTALVALENSKLTDEVVVDEDCISFLRPGDAAIGLKKGEKLTMDQALHATLLASANEAACAVAKNTTGDYDWFIAKMNERAKELGAANSHFMNANGLHHDEHYTTARDMALISRELYQHPEALEIMQTLHYKIPKTNKSKDAREMYQKHAMLRPDKKDYYQYALGGKTGYTTEALNTLVTYAEKDGMELVCVEMKTFSGKIFGDTKKLLDYGFQNFSKASIAENDESGSFESVDNDGYVVLPKGIAFDQLESNIVREQQDSSKATVNYTYQNQPMGSAAVTLSESYKAQKRPKVETVQQKGKDSDKKTKAAGSILSIPIKVLIASAVIVILIVVLLLIMRQSRRRKRSRKRR